MKPTYSIDAPDQQRLKVARLEIEAVLRKHDLAGVVVLHTPGMSEFVYDIRPTYSCCWVDEQVPALRLKSKLADYCGDRALQMHDRAATANMVEAISDNLWQAAQMFVGVAGVVNKAFAAEHTTGALVADPAEGSRQ